MYIIIYTYICTYQISYIISCRTTYVYPHHAQLRQATHRLARQRTSLPVVWMPPFFAGWCPPRSQWIIDDYWLIIIDDCWWLLMMIEWMIDDYSTLSAVLGCKIAIQLWMLAPYGFVGKQSTPRTAKFNSLLSNHHFSLKIVMNGRYTLF
jgi:hypothetical protein